MSPRSAFVACFFFFNDTATTEIYTLSLHDALPIYPALAELPQHLIAGIEDLVRERGGAVEARPFGRSGWRARSEEHTSELQSLAYLVCRLLLEKKKIILKDVTLATQRTPSLISY